MLSLYQTYYLLNPKSIDVLEQLYIGDYKEDVVRDSLKIEEIGIAGEALNPGDPQI